MTPSMRTVVRTRYWLRFVWRAVIALMVFWGLWTQRYAVTSGVRTAFDPSPGLGPLYYLWSLVCELAPYAVLAGLMIALERTVLRWLAPPPTTGCPNCGYPLPPRPGPCPECGLVVPAPSARTPA